MTKKQILDLNNLIPSSLQNDTLTSLVSNTFNRFLSEEQSVLVNGRVGTPVSGEPNIQAENLERGSNALIPALYYKNGAEEQVATFEDLVNKLENLGADVTGMRGWMQEQNFNFSPPINYDKFINFSNYFWVGKEVRPNNAWNPDNDPEFYVIRRPADCEESAYNDWQRSNLWVHIDDFCGGGGGCSGTAGSSGCCGCSMELAIQATRPIIEYADTLQLNAASSGGFPTQGSTTPQTKYKFNQIPQFNLYRYDGTHSGQVSGLFFYAEDSNYPVDSVLRRRVVTDANTDFVFSIGMMDSHGRLLYYSDSVLGLCSIWRGGPASPRTGPIKLNGTPTSALEVTVWKPGVDNQDWTVKALSPLTFGVSGSRSGAVGIATVGTPFQCDDMTFVIAAGTSPYKIGDTFNFSVHAPLSPRYVRAQGSKLVNYPGGAVADTQEEGCWLVPLRMFQNMGKETRERVAFGDLLGHMRNVLRNQDNFEGVSFGINNSRILNIDPGLGGTIRDFSSNFPLLASLLLQQDVSPLSILEFAETSYNAALASIDQFMLNDFLAALGAVPWTSTGTVPSSATIQSLKQKFEQLRRDDANLSQIFGDSTSGVAAWPASLSALGQALGSIKYTPQLAFDPELGITVIQHHDGHTSPSAVRNLELDLLLVKTPLLRSDGITEPGKISEIAPSTPYARQLWYQPSSQTLRFFNVDFDSATIPTAAAPSGAAAYWFKRGTSELYSWDTAGGKWVLSGDSLASRWIELDVAGIRNGLVLAVESALYDAVPSKFSQAQNLRYDLSAGQGTQYDEGELARFATKYGYDVYAPDYVASDAFTWNYSSSAIAGMTTVPARWHEIYKRYFNKSGISLATCRPNLEPWKLLNLAEKPTSYFYAGQYRSWDEHFAAEKNVVDIDLSSVDLSARVVSTTPITLAGPAIVDGLAVVDGDRVLVAGQANALENGIYVVSTSAAWTRIPAVLADSHTVMVTEGYQLSDTYWICSASGSPTSYEYDQVRLWSDHMWQHILIQRPGRVTCVNIKNDSLLPPYVSPSKYTAAQALINVIPTSAADSYSFGDNGPVEIVWKKSLEYRYSLARNCFRLNPLRYLDSTWGYTYFKLPSSTRTERNSGAILPASSFLLHGERPKIVQGLTEAETAARIVGSLTRASSVPASATVELVFEITEVLNNSTYAQLFVNGDPVALLRVNDPELEISHSSLETAPVRLLDRGIPYELGDRITVSIANTTTTWSYEPTTRKRFVGLCQSFTHLLRFNRVDTESSQTSTAYRGWDIKLAHRVGALLRADTLTIDTLQGVLPPTAFNVLLKRSPNIDGRWLSALRVQLVDMGPLSTLTGERTRKTNSEGYLVPSADASTWVFRIEGYNSRHPFIEYYNYNTSGDYQTFQALSGAHTPLEWKRYTEKTSLVSSILPLTVTGLQATVNVIFGYIDRLEELDWNFGSSQSADVDAATGRSMNWQLEIEKLIDNVYTGISAGDAAGVLNPFMSVLTFDTPTGLAGRYAESTFIDTYTTQAVYDVSGTVIPVSNLHIIRTDDAMKTVSQTPMFSAHLFRDEYEHVILLNQRISDEPNSATLFDPFLNIQIESAYMNFYRQRERNRKPSFNGFFLKGNGVARNIFSSIDNIANYYDSTLALTENQTAEHSLALLGFSKKPYFTNISTDVGTQFNFWRGLIQAKGTNMTVDAFVNYRKFLDSSVDEYWAYKIAEYGDARERSFPELKISTNDVNQSYTKLQFFDISDSSYSALPLFTQVANIDDTRWYSLDDLGTVLKFEATPVSETFTVKPGTTLPALIPLKTVFCNDDSGLSSISGPGSPSLLNARVAKVTATGTYTVRGYAWRNPTKLSPIKLFDYRASDLTTEIGLWHPAAGIHAPSALSLVNISSTRDPALYTYSTQTTTNPNLQYLKPWASREVGRVWWDQSNLDYVPYYDSRIFTNREEREARWGSLAEWASIDLYQWTESPVHPSLYDDLAAKQEGDLEIDRTVRLSGKVGKVKYYSRGRTVSITPIAWSKTGVGASAGHPSFGPARFTKVYASGKNLVADTGTLSAIGLSAGQHFAGWKINKPYGEVEIGSDVTYDIGSSTALSQPVFTVTGVLASASLQPIDGGLYGSRLGSITIKKKVYKEKEVQTSGSDIVTVLVDRYALRMSDSTGFYEDVRVDDWYSASLTSDSTVRYDFRDFGISLVLERSVSSMSLPGEIAGQLPAQQIVTAVHAATKDIFIREKVNFTEIIPLPDDTFINDPADPEYFDTEYEWKAWSVPTQAQLDEDMPLPDSAWRAYVGDPVTVSATADLIQRMKDDTSARTLVDGTEVNRFSSSWSAWTSLERSITRVISDGSTLVSAVLPETPDPARLSVYRDGLQLNQTAYRISGSTVTLLRTVPQGSTITFLLRAYQPSEKELAFDPDVADNVAIQRHYKKDYEYTVVETRDTSGNVSGKKYYFWVRSKTVSPDSETSSLVTASALLQDGESAYAIFSRARGSVTDPYFDSCAIYGLNNYVAKNNTFKLRFTRDFALRDDPEELRLKNTHTEWTLIRRGQPARIPKSLWDRITDAVCGQDVGGNPLPSQVRRDYDARNGTRTRFGFKSGQIFADTALVKSSLLNAIINTPLTIKIGQQELIDYITVLDFDRSDEWFSTPVAARATMTAIWNGARNQQINSLFFSVLEDALADNYEFSDIFKTSYIAISTTTQIEATSAQEQTDGIY